MTTYIITEKQDINSHRDGEEIQARNLSEAKRAASRKQFFQGTVLTVENSVGDLLSAKENGSWRDK